jgi:hypothetical protein
MEPETDQVTEVALSLLKAEAGGSPSKLRT